MESAGLQDRDSPTDIFGVILGPSRSDLAIPFEPPPAHLWVILGSPSLRFNIMLVHLNAHLGASKRSRAFAHVQLDMTRFYCETFLASAAGTSLTFLVAMRPSWANLGSSWGHLGGILGYQGPEKRPATKPKNMQHVVGKCIWCLLRFSQDHFSQHVARTF